MHTLSFFSAALALCALTACSPSDLEPVELTQQALAVIPASDAGLSAIDIMQQQLSRSPAHLRFSEHDSGVHQVHIAEGFQHATLLVRAPDGTVVRHCVNDAREALQLLGEGAP